MYPPARQPNRDPAPDIDRSPAAVLLAAQIAEKLETRACDGILHIIPATV